MKKRITALIMALVLMMSMAVGAVAASVEQFKDVAPTDWYYTYVKDVVSKNYMNGTSKSTFSPNDNLTRAMASTVLARVENVKVDNAADSGFVDVPVNQWYTGSVKWMFEKKLVKGYGNNKFGPNDFITRQDAAVMMANYLKMKSYKETGKSTVAFVDMAKVSTYAKDSVNLCAEAGIIVGVPNGNFEPLRNITRAEFASMIRKLDKVVYGTIGSGGSSGGGSSDDGPSLTSATYNVKVNATVNSDISALNHRTLNLTSRDYTVFSNGSGDKTVAQVAKDLVADESLALTNAIGQGLDAAKNKTKTVTVAGKTATVSIDAAGNISTQVVMDLSSMSNVSAASTFSLLSSVVTFTASGAEGAYDPSFKPSMAQINDLLSQMNANPNNLISLTSVDQQKTLVYLQEKANEVQGWSDDDITAAINNYTSGNEELKQLAAGVTVEEVKTAAGSYAANLQNAADTARTHLKSNSNPSPNLTIPAPAKPVTSTISVKVNMSTYLTSAKAKYNAYKTDSDTQTRVVNEFNDRYKDAYTRAGLDPAAATLATWADLQPLFADADPDQLVTDNGDGTLKMQTKDDYYTILAKSVTDSADLWDKLDAPAAVCQYAINKATSEAAANGQTFTADTILADVLSNQTGFMNGRSDVTLLTVSATDSIEDVVFNKIKNLLAGRITLSTNPIGDVIDTMNVTVVLDKR